MGDKTDAGIAPKQTIMVWRLHFMAENYEADLLNENHLKYKSGVSLFTDRLEIIAMLSQMHASWPGIMGNRDRCR